MQELQTYSDLNINNIMTNKKMVKHSQKIILENNQNWHGHS